MKNIILNGEICFFINGFDIRYSPLTGGYRLSLEKESGVEYELKMFSYKGNSFLICCNGNIEDIIFKIFGLRHNIYMVDIEGVMAVDFDVFGKYVKANCSEKK